MNIRVTLHLLRGGIGVATENYVDRANLYHCAAQSPVVRTCATQLRVTFSRLRWSWFWCTHVPRPLGGHGRVAPLGMWQVTRWRPREADILVILSTATPWISGPNCNAGAAPIFSNDKSLLMVILHPIFSYMLHLWNINIYHTESPVYIGRYTIHGALQVGYDPQ